MNYSFYVDENLVSPDFRIVGGELSLVRGADNVVQQIIITLKTEIGEWFLNVNFGIPYFTRTGIVNDNTNNGILGSNFDESIVQSFITAAILQVPGVESVNDLLIEKMQREKSVRIEATVTVEDSDVNGIGTQRTFTVNIGD